MALAGRIKSGMPLLTKALRSDPLSTHDIGLFVVFSVFDLLCYNSFGLGWLGYTSIWLLRNQKKI
jgi:hypothetical protein